MPPRVRSLKTLKNGKNHIGHNYIGHNYIGHNYLGHNYMGHNYIGPSYVGHKSGEQPLGRRDRTRCLEARSGRDMARFGIRRVAVFF